VSVDVDYPADLPCVSRIDGYQQALRSSVTRTPFDAGNARQRRLNTTLPTEIALSWRVPDDQLQPLVAWLNAYGFDWFNLLLAGVEPSGAAVESSAIVVRLMSDIQCQLLNFYRVNWWQVSAQAEYRSPVLSDFPTTGYEWIVGGASGTPSPDRVISDETFTDWIVAGTAVTPSA